MTNEQQTFKEHLQELTRRLLWPAGLFGVGMLAGFVWFKQLSHLLTKPLGETLYYTSPTGGLNYMMFIGLVLGVALALPVLVYQIVQFIRPVHHKITTRSAVMIMLASLGMAVLGVLYAYLISMPGALKFLTDIGGTDVQSWITTTDYISFLTAYLLGSAAIFQLPVILFFIDHIRPIPPGGLKKAQRPVILACFVVGAMLTPTPDPYNQLMVAGPMLLLFEMSCLMVVVRHAVVRRRVTKLARTERPVDAPAVQPVVTQPVAFAESADSHSFMPAPSFATVGIEPQVDEGYTRSVLSGSAEPKPINLTDPSPKQRTRPLILDIRTQHPA